MQVGAHFAHDEAWPDVIQTYLVQTGFQPLKEGIEGLLVSQTAVYLFGSYFVGDRSDVVCFAEVLGMLDQLNRTFHHHMDVDDLTFRQEDIHCRVHVNEVITGEESRLVTLLHTVHGTLGVPALDALFVFEPRTAVVNRHYVWTRVMNGCRLTSQDLREDLLCHTRITTIAVHLIEGGSEINRRVVTFRCAERSLDYRQGVRASCKERHRNSSCFFTLLHYAEDILSFCHSLLAITRATSGHALVVALRNALALRSAK